jgi:hypothetical protein
MQQTMGQIAYDQFCRTLQDQRRDALLRPLPWQEQSTAHKEAWEAAATAVQEELARDMTQTINDAIGKKKTGPIRGLLVMVLHSLVREKLASSSDPVHRRAAIEKWNPE